MEGRGACIAARFEGKRLNAPNDIVVRRDGNVVFHRSRFRQSAGYARAGFLRRVSRSRPNGELEAIARWKTRPNGIALSPNGRLLYVADSDARLIRAYDLAGNGAASNERVFIDKIAGVPGGLRTDEKGNLYAAAEAVFVYSPKGEMLKEIHLARDALQSGLRRQGLLDALCHRAHRVYRVRAGGMKGAPPYAPQVP